MGKSALIFLLVCVILGITTPVLTQEAAKVTPVAPAVAPVETGEEETDIVAGKVATVDVANSTLTVKDEAGKSYTLAATKEETSIWKGDDTIELSDVKGDDSVELEYYKNKDGKLVAIWIDVLTKEAAAPQEATPAPATSETTPPPIQ